jgi:predicted dehydrogenase
LRLLSVDGSIIVGEGIHHVDLARWFTASEYDRICCLGTSIAYTPYPDHQAMIATMKNNIMVNIESSHGYGFSSQEPLMDRQAHLIGDGGVIRWCETDGNRLSLYGKNRTEHMILSEGKQSKLLYDDFITACLQNKPTDTLPTLTDGLAAMEAVERAQQIASQQQPET